MNSFFVSMRQIGIIPAGCQQSFYGGVIVTKDFYIYASSVAVYFLNPSTFKIEKIIAYNSRAICSFCVSELDPNLMIVGSMDGSISAWRIGTEENISKTTIPFNTRCYVDCDPYDAKSCFVALMNGLTLNISIW